MREVDGIQLPEGAVPLSDEQLEEATGGIILDAAVGATQIATQWVTPKEGPGSDSRVMFKDDDAVLQGLAAGGG